MANRTWVLLRGLARESGHWGDFPEKLETAFAGDRVLTIDLPGAGQYRDVAAPRSLRDTAAFVRDRARDQADGRPVTLFTVSLGAMVGLEWQARHPNEVEALVAVNTSHAGLSRAHARLRWQVWVQFIKLLGNTSPRERERAIIDLVINDPAGQAAALGPWTKVALARPIKPIVALNQLWAAARGGLLPATDRVLVLNSLGDRLVDPSCSTRLAAANGWTIQRHPWAGHDLTWDDGDWVIARLRSWISRVT